MSAFFDYVKNGGDEIARARAEAEYTAGHLGSALDELNELRAENEKLRAALERATEYIATAGMATSASDVRSECVEFCRAVLGSDQKA